MHGRIACAGAIHGVKDRPGSRTRPQSMFGHNAALNATSREPEGCEIVENRGYQMRESSRSSQGSGADDLCNGKYAQRPTHWCWGHQRSSLEAGATYAAMKGARYRARTV